MYRLREVVWVFWILDSIDRIYIEGMGNSRRVILLG